MPRFLPEAEPGEPVVSRKQATDLLMDWLREAEREYRGKEVEWDTKARSECIYRFRASELYLGPLTRAAFAGWAARELKIQPKEAHRTRLIPFSVNTVQWDFLGRVLDERYLKDLAVRAVILKARQFGISTLVAAMQFFFVTSKDNINATTLAHKADATANLYEMSKRYLRNLKNQPRMLRTNARELVMAPPFDSRLRLETAEAKETGRSSTNQIVHASEEAFWRTAKVSRLGLMQTVPDAPGTMVFEESTANGIGNVFHTQYELGKRSAGSMFSVFYPWWVHAPYQVPNLKRSKELEILGSLDEEETWQREAYDLTAGQILWRRITIETKCGGDLLLFNQEYPHNDRVAFLTSGAPVFDQDVLSRRLEEAGSRSPLFKGLLVPAED